jgi:DNA-binding CsgD family transcriptional regulator
MIQHKDQRRSLVIVEAARHFDAEARDELRLMRKGRRPQEIALMRGVRVRRIYWVTEKLRGRFGADTNEHLIARAAEEGFLS